MVEVRCRGMSGDGDDSALSWVRGAEGAEVAGVQF